MADEAVIDAFFDEMEQLRAAVQGLGLQMGAKDWDWKVLSRMARAVEKHANNIASASDNEWHREHETTGQEVFTDDQLRYAATARCRCGAGLAYPKEISHRQPAKGFGGAWFCSDVLTNRVPFEEGKHDAGLPFAFYEIKSEEQPSANGRTTRPSHVHYDPHSAAGEGS